MNPADVHAMLKRHIKSLSEENTKLKRDLKKGKAHLLRANQLMDAAFVLLPDNAVVTGDIAQFQEEAKQWLG